MNKVTIKKLLCKERHKVPNEHDEKNELTCDGFIFEDETTSVKWLNQYPRASYGQIDESCDRMVFSDEPDSEESLDSRIMCDLRTRMQSMIRGVNDLTEEGAVSEAASLQQHFDDIKKMVEDEFKMSTVVANPDVPWRKVSFVPI